MRDSASGNKPAAQGTDGDAVSFWMTEARTRVTENPGLEVMAQRTIVLDCPDEQLWNAISDPMHWQADAFHNEIVSMNDQASAGTHFEMLHTNPPIEDLPLHPQATGDGSDGQVLGEAQPQQLHPPYGARAACRYASDP